MSDENRKVYRVTELTRLIKSLLESQFRSVWLEGEISNLRRPSSGHLYFTLKDATAQMRMVFFRGSQQYCTVQVKDGMKVRVYGNVSIYEQSGDYQLLVRTLEEAGKGTLQEQFEKLKLKLSHEGLFDPSRKKPLPILPRCVGIVTSPTGAAIRDIFNILERRFPNIHLIVSPAKVQGPGAAEEIANAIRMLNRHGRADVMIIGRGGGSIEDLWCFNEEVVARAIAASRIPIISGVGHEIDFTISDFTADLRAPTPSAAAELVVGRKDQFEETLQTFERHFASLMQSALQQAEARLVQAASSYVFKEPAHLIGRYAQRLDNLELRMVQCLRTTLQQRTLRLQRVAGSRIFSEPARRIQDERIRVQRLQERLARAAENAVNNAQNQLQKQQIKLTSLSPFAVLKRGYSIVSCGDKIIRRADEVHPGDTMKISLAQGAVHALVDHIELEESKS
ncbi:MAG: exodeoxyribonuclease VII large subunit [Spartobacteria bacterium]|nr:exodeoxyribonuclease VII large subunit [Spartobacteria bacterium]